MVEISSAVTSTMIGMMGVVIGAIISNYFNQKIARESARKDIVFKKKIEYFEKIVDTIEKNTKLWQNSIKDLERQVEKKKVQKIIDNLKLNRKKFEVMTSPLYLDTRQITKIIKIFVNIEKIMFSFLEQLKRYSKENEEENILGLRKSIKELELTGNKIIFELRTNLLI